jgi:hypothetical protein
LLKQEPSTFLESLQMVRTGVDVGGVGGTEIAVPFENFENQHR